MSKSTNAQVFDRTAERAAAVARFHTASVLLVVSAIIWTLSAMPTRAQTQAGDVASIKGEAQAEAAEKRRPLVQGTVVFVDEVITTGASSRLTLNLGRNTTIKLGEGVRMRIDRHMVNAGGAFDLQSGAVLFDRGAGAPKGDTALRSPYGLLAVRGTKFFAGPSNGVFGVFVVRGRVDVTGAGKTVRLTAGLGTNIASPGDAPTKPAAWKAPRVKAALLSVQ